ncbi:hypothetical protein [Streptomyces apocyni]|uniref:hypothetical protein n=1 Tax=Streptomyces apocyni TaxID=2654677 RepID=UPI001E31AD74|nr:hypothetical protein [Streptomyces apocyni]
MSRVVMAASVVAALGFTAACGGSDSGSEGKDKPSAEKTTEAAKPKPQPQAEALSADELEEAALAKGDVKGFSKVVKTPKDEMPVIFIPASDKKCQPLANLFFFATRPGADARVGRTLLPDGLMNTTANTVALMAYKQSDAEKVIGDLRTATEDCTKYEHVEYQYSDVKALPDPKLGDESVSFQMVGDIEGDKMGTSYTVVRSGSTVVGFRAMDMLDVENLKVPDAIIKAQLAKLEKVAG